MSLGVFAIMPFIIIVRFFFLLFIFGNCEGCEISDPDLPACLIAFVFELFMRFPGVAS